MANGVLIPSSVAAEQIGSLVKTGVHATVAQQNGWVAVLGAKSTTAGQLDAYVITTPATATLATADFYMVYEAPIPTSTNGWKGLTDDPREFAVAATKPCSIYKPHIGDEIILTVDALAGTKGTNTFIVPADGTGALTWAANTTGVSLGYFLEGTTFVSIGNARVVAYKFRCVVANA